MTEVPVLLPPAFAATRESLRALACYAIAPARKAATGRIGLRPTGEGFGTPPFADGSRIVVRADQLVREPGGSRPITTVRAAAEFLGVVLSADPGVGSDLPPFAPDAPLAVDPDASTALGGWYAFGARVLDRLAASLGEAGTVTEAQLWPEHFDLAVEVALSNGRHTNIGFSPGDHISRAPYVYVGPHDRGGLGGDFWNAPFGAVLGHDVLAAAAPADDAAYEFLLQGLRLLRAVV